MDVASEFPAEASDGDYVLLRTMSDAKFDSDKDFRLSIRRVCEKYLEVRTSEQVRKLLDEKPLYEVKFRKDRTVFRFEQQAIQTIESKVIPKTLFPRECGEAANPSMTFEWFSNSVKTNYEQQQAVRNIVHGSSFPAPYILFGPPGTGKTTTLVEAIAQVWKEKPDAHILVSAPSNYACNEILIRLMQLNCVPETEMFRYLSKSQLRKVDTIDERILEVSNIDKQHQYKEPSLETLSQYRIIFLTLVTAGRLALNGMSKDHFDYIFIDEAGSATEASTIIPIAGLVSFGGFKRRNHIIIAGDPKQLGPIVLHRQSEKLLYGRSMLDRLMELDLYKPDPVTKQYNAACLTKLLQNFRSHKNILDIPNKLFYDAQLIAKAKPDVTNIALGHAFLPNKKVPIVFHAVFGETKREEDNPSLFNKQECAVVLDYVRKVLKIKFEGQFIEPQEIGIISPYRRQCMEISRMLRLRMKLTGIEVGSVEQFQGQERKVIILSTVRSFTETIGFLNNPKRLNVSITRAKALLVIVGNPRTLQLDKNWHQLIKYCVEHNVCTGKSFELNESVRGRFKDKSQRNGFGRNVAEMMEAPKTKEPKKRPRRSRKTIPNYSNDKVTEEFSSSVSQTTENESIDETSDLVSDLESLDLQDEFSSDCADLNTNITDDDEEANYKGTHFLVSEDVFSSDEEFTDDDQSTMSNNNNLCDNDDTETLDTTITESKPKDLSNDIFDLDFHFDSFGFVH